MLSPIPEAYERLLEHFGPQHWWPARTRLEMMLGAILTQNTAWTNVEKAIANLRRAGALRLPVLEQAAREEIAEWIRPAGYFNQKAGYIKGMAEKIRDRFDGSLHRLFALDTPVLRRELLSWKGVGPETADSILIYAAERPVFVVDAYTRRVCTRHGWIDGRASYDDVAQLFTDHLPEDVRLYNEYHALIVRLCKEHCNTRPRCRGCPLECLLAAE
jgi:endonuclease-3 related protein